MFTRTLMGASVIALMTSASIAEAQDSRSRFQRLKQVTAVQSASFVQQQHERFRCESGQKKHLVIVGAEDGFSSSGSEPAVKSARVAANPANGWNVGLAPTFDNTRINEKVFSHINLPPNVKRGKFMIGLREIGAQVNTDGMNIGNLSAAGLSAGERAGYAYSNGWNTLAAVATQSGNNYAVDFSNVNLLNNTTLQQYYDTSGDTILDVYVQDDHSVDYVAASVCTAPDKKGMTWGIRPPQPEAVNGVAHVGCNDASGNKCDPYQGDTVCTAAVSYTHLTLPTKA